MTLITAEANKDPVLKGAGLFFSDRFLGRPITRSSIEALLRSALVPRGAQSYRPCVRLSITRLHVCPIKVGYAVVRLLKAPARYA